MVTPCDRSRSERPWSWAAGLALALLVLGHWDTHAATPAISAGNRHVLALAADGTLRAWGDDSSGQLGLGRTLQVNTPAIIPGLSAVSKVSVGANHVVALMRDGTVQSWGRNTLGELGDGTTTSRPTPAPVTGLTGIIDIASGEGHTLALKSDGTVWSWGVNYRGQLGYEESSLVPARVPGLPAIRRIAAGYGHSLALAQDGIVWAWGAGDFGQLGDGTRTPLYSGRARPVPVDALSGVAEVSAGLEFSVAVKQDGTVWAWGRNGAGELGNATLEFSLLPIRVNGVADVASVSSGIDHTLALLRDGTLRAWGGGYPGQLGDGRNDPSPTPVRVEGLTGVTQTAAGYFYSVARTSDGAVWVWGYNSNGQLGDGTTENRSTPARLNGITAASVAAGGFHTFAVLGDGRVMAWGANDFGELGAGGGVLRSTPAVVPGVNGIKAIAAGGAHSLALRSDGTVLAWGGNGLGQLGDGTYQSRSTPAPVPNLSGVRAVAAGYYHSMALKEDGTVWMWGYGYDGQMGNGTNESLSSPTQVPGLAGIVFISTGDSHVFAMAGDGTIWAWGGNGSGQLGDGSNVDRLTPVRVSASTGLSGVKAVSAGSGHSLALTNDGRVWSWGLNYSGELGTGSDSNRNLPGPVPGLTGVTAISAGSAFSHALKSDGTIWAWGANWSNQLGDGSSDSQPTPVPIGGLNGVTQVSGGGANGVALKSDGTVWAWGRNIEGRLGDGTFIDRSAPVVVLREEGGGSLASNDWFLDLNPAIAKTIPSDKIPVFLVVAASARGDVTAQLRYRPQDVGTTASTYVFASAPANLVRPAADGSPPLVVGKSVSRGAAKADAVACVLAQLNASGQLVSVTTAQLQAYLSGTLSAQGASVSILNNVPAGNVAGSTFFVGYGSNATSMLNGGINRSVVSMPGQRECKPQAPQTGWWWNPREDGRGFSLEVRGNNLFFAAFLYDISGRSTWYVSTGPVSLDGSLYNGDLLSARGGQTLGGAYPGFPTLASVGPMTLAFDDASHGTLVWPGGAVPIERFNIVPNGLNLPPVAGEPESGWWWNEQEAGRGFFLEWQGGNLDIAGYMYDDAGNSVWYLTTGAIGGTETARSFSGNWWSFGGGQTLTGAWKPNTRLSSNVAPVTITFSGPDTALMTLPNGRTTSLRRHRF